MSEATATPQQIATSERRLALTARQLEGLCLGILAMLSLITLLRILGNGTLIGQDSATQFYPWYSYLGERLRDFDIPSWNPSQFSGAPFAADPQSGWTYLPAMVLFTALPLSLAIAAYLSFHLLLAGFGAYALARVLGIGPLGALASGIAYQLSGPVFSRSICCPAQLQVICWVPVVLIGVEMTMRRTTWESRIRWMALSAFAMSQIVASWVGQGSYYAALLAGAYTVYRGAIDPPDRLKTGRQRLGLVLFCGVGIALMTAGLSAAGIIPRLEFNALSNVAGGEYHNAQVTAAVSGGWQAGGTFYRDVTTDPYYPGSVVIALAVIGLLLARGRYSTPFFTFVVLIAFVLSASTQTPLHSFFYIVLPRFEAFHRHWPERIAMAGFIAIAILAGAAIDALPSLLGKHRRALRIAALPLAIAAVFAIFLHRSGDALSLPVYAGIGVTIAAVLVVGYGASQQRAWATSALLVAVLAIELSIANGVMARNGPYGGYFDVDLDQYFAPSNAGQFLIGQQREQVTRFFGFDPRLQQMSAGLPVYYRYQFGNERTRSIVVNNRATLHGLHDLQGYNPVQLQAYVEYMTLLNGQEQDYHDENVLPSGLDSPLLDILNARYFVIPSDLTAEGDPLLQELARTYVTVFDDGYTRVLARPTALPRAWIVHNAVQAAGLDGAVLVSDGTIDPSRTAAIDGPIPSLQPVGSMPESATIVSYEPERIVIRTDSPADGILLLSEVDYPAWRATIDGVEVEIQTAFGLIRAIPLPAGTHTVAFEYVATAEENGLIVTSTTAAGIVALLGILAFRRRRMGQLSGEAEEKL
ncbi:MAG: YfhO family protein [Thermomicrobiales bacterium]|nr:YfhO family protein [Thermomicrobiales bacterium]